MKQKYVSIVSPFYKVLLAALLIFSFSTAFGKEIAKEKKFNPGELIMDHIGDAHDWHLWGEGDGATAIPLPVIIYSKQRGLDAFSSSNFQHGHKTYKGYKLDHNHVVAVN